MNKYIEIKCESRPERGSDAFSVDVKVMCDIHTAAEFMASAMYKLNNDCNALLPGDHKNVFWNMVVEIVGERMLEDSKR